MKKSIWNKAVFIKAACVLAAFSALYAFSSCSYMEYGRVYVQNNTNLQVTDIVIEWESQNGNEKIEIDQVSGCNTGNSKSRTYAAFLADSGTLFGSDKAYKTPFTVSYKIGDQTFDVKNSESATQDESGNFFDEKAYFSSGNTTLISIFENSYIIVN